MRKQKVVLAGTLKQEFQKDLELFKYFLLLLNNSSPIRNVELMWVDELDPQKPKFKERVSTCDALVQLQPAGTMLSNRNSPSTLFCDLVHGFGAHEEETCALSDVPAKQKCQATGCSQVYACHVGLTDIAVPVICDGQYLGTLFSGQVLVEPPNPAGFEKVKDALQGQPHIDFRTLEAAYYRVPVVDPAQLTEMLRVLELFARYIANSWKRLEIMSDFQTMREREVTLNRKELAAILLLGEIGDRRELNNLATNVGLRRLPDRVLVLRMKPGPETTELQPQIANNVAMSRMAHMVEDLCQNWTNTLAISVRPGEICIFTHQEGRNPSHGRIRLQEMAESILMAVKAQGISAARFGISGLHSNPEELLRAFHEACAALDNGKLPVNFFEEAAPQQSHPTQLLTPVVKAIQQGGKVDAAVREFLARAIPVNGPSSQVQQARGFITWSMEHLALEMINIGTDAKTVTAKKEQLVREVLNTPSPFSICESFRKFTEFLQQQVAWTFSQKENKIVHAVAQLVEERGAANITIQQLAEALHVSSGHLSRIYSRTTGMTLEEYLIRQRIELAKRMLLDPRLNVAEVAELSGFCNPAYFASVFKKYVHCTPREFANTPCVWKPMTQAGGNPVSLVSALADSETSII